MIYLIIGSLLIGFIIGVILTAIVFDYIISVLARKIGECMEG